MKEHPGAGEGVVEGVVAVDAVDAEFLDERREAVVREVGTKAARQR